MDNFTTTVSEEGDLNSTLNSYFDNESDNFTTLAEKDLKFMVDQIARREFINLPVSLSEWQISQLVNLEEAGISCLLSMWFSKEPEVPTGKRKIASFRYMEIGLGHIETF